MNKLVVCRCSSGSPTLLSSTLLSFWHDNGSKLMKTLHSFGDNSAGESHKHFLHPSPLINHGRGPPSLCAALGHRRKLFNQLICSSLCAVNDSASFGLSGHPVHLISADELIRRLASFCLLPCSLQRFVGPQLKLTGQGSFLSLFGGRVASGALLQWTKVPKAHDWNVMNEVM